jgi:hypothetical protein
VAVTSVTAAGLCGRAWYGLAGGLAPSRSAPFGSAWTLVAPGVAGIAVADTGVGVIAGAVEANPVMHVPTFDPLDVAGDFTQHGAAPRDLGPVHSTISWNRCRRWKGIKV